MVSCLDLGKKVLIVYAHQEPRSFNGALKDVAVAELSQQGCSVTVSDLYALNFGPRATGKDITGESQMLCGFFFSNFLLLVCLFSEVQLTSPYCFRCVM